MAACTVSINTSASHWDHSIVLCAEMLQRVFRYCANEYKMDVGKFGLLFSLSVVYTRTIQISGNVVSHRNGYNDSKQKNT